MVTNKNNRYQDVIFHNVKVVVDIVFSIKPLVNVLEPEVRILETESKSNVKLKDVFQLVSTQAKMQNYIWVDKLPDDISSFELAVNNFIKFSLKEEVVELYFGDSSDGLRELIERAINGNFRSLLDSKLVKSSEGFYLNVYTCGLQNRPPVVLVSACGMPVELSEKWIRVLSKHFFVITWETRGLFGWGGEGVPKVNISVDSQVSDLITILDELKISQAHLLGFCGGAVIALKAAEIQSELFPSLSVWHGDFDFANKCPKTTHQNDVEALMHIAGESISMAESYQKLFYRPSVLKSMPVHTAHLVMYPYACAKLFHLYSKLNGAIMGTDISEVIPNVSQPVLIVTSKDDNTAHPEGSRKLFQYLSNSTLVEEPCGDHLSLFDAKDNMTDLAVSFIFRLNYTTLKV